MLRTGGLKAESTQTEFSTFFFHLAFTSETMPEKMTVVAILMAMTVMMTF